MAHLFSGYISTQKLEEILKTVKARGEKGFKFTGSVNDEADKFGNNVSFFAEQSKEAREAKQPKYYFGSGKVFWTNGQLPTIPEKVEKKESNPFGDNFEEVGLPF